MKTRFVEARRIVPQWRLASVALASVVALAGCTNPFSPEGTAPGVYKGKSDPLFEEPAEARDAALRERFELIQRR